MMFRSLAVLAALTLSFTASTPAVANDYPNAPVRMIYPYAAGGSGDALARLFAEAMTKELGQQVFVDNRPGAGGNIGFAAASREKADGYTLLSISPAYAINVTLYGDPGYKAGDFIPVAAASVVPNVLLVNTNSPFKTVKELVDYAKANPGKLSFGSAGVGASTHFAGELLKAQAKIDLVHIPYKGASLAGTDLLGGRLDLIFDSAPSALANVRTGKARALMIASTARSEDFPGVPTAAEAGLPDLLSQAWTGIVAPKGTPKPIVDKLSATVDKVRKDPAVVAGLAKLGGRPLDMTPEQFAPFIAEEITRYGTIIKAIDLRP